MYTNFDRWLTEAEQDDAEQFILETAEELRDALEDGRHEDLRRRVAHIAERCDVHVFVRAPLNRW